MSQPWTRDELQSHVETYHVAGNARNRRLLLWLFASVAAVFAAFGLVALLRFALPRPATKILMTASLLAFVVSIAALAVYILLTAKRFRQRHGINCDVCRTEYLFPQIDNDEILADSKEFVCRTCRAVIAR